MSTFYIGRFAPSPTGELHAGSLYAALASYLDAKAHNGIWLVRIEDIDAPRVVDGSADNIIESLALHGLTSDRPVLYQSTRTPRYETVLQQLIDQQRCFYCTCSRKNLTGISHYSGACRNYRHQRSEASIRIQVPSQGVEHFHDRVQGLQHPPSLDEGTVFDFIIKRKDNFFSYQLACVVDDIDQGVTHIVRGMDILDSTFKQVFLYRMLNEQPPSYLHLPIIVNQTGQKLSKQNFATPINNEQACFNLVTALTALNQPTPAPSNISNVDAILDFAIHHWQPERINALSQINA